MREPTKYEVRWSLAAANDLERIVDFVAKEKPSAAQKWVDALYGSAQSLVRFPLRGRLVPELKAMGLDIYREFLHDVYRILYRIRAGKVFVLGVFDGRRDLEDVFYERLRGS